jgi:hypothetical protein
MSAWENQSQEEYLFEVFCQDKIESNIQNLMISCTKNHGKSSGSASQLRQVHKKELEVHNCETCPLFEGWKDRLGIPVLSCRFVGKTWQGVTCLDLFNHVHHRKGSVRINLIMEEHG